MASEPNALRSRRALLAAAAGSAAAVVASAALPLTAVAAPVSVMSEQDNSTQLETTISNHGVGNAFTGHSVVVDGRYGVEGTSLAASGIAGWSVSPPDIDTASTLYTGVFGSSPASPTSSAVGTGVWGDSPDIGVYGSGGSGVVGFGAVGVEGDANSSAGSIGVRAFAPSTAQIALKVTGKVSLSRSGRTTMSSRTSSKAISLAGVTSTSKVFAVLASNRSGRYIRAIVPASGKFTIYLNTTLSSSAVVSWFVLD